MAHPLEADHRRLRQPLAQILAAERMDDRIGGPFDDQHRSRGGETLGQPVAAAQQRQVAPQLRHPRRRHRAVLDAGGQMLHRLRLGHPLAEFVKKALHIAAGKAVVHGLQGQAQGATGFIGGNEAGEAGQQHHRIGGRQHGRWHQVQAEGIDHQGPPAPTAPAGPGDGEASITPVESPQTPAALLTGRGEPLPAAVVAAPAMGGQQLPGAGLGHG